MKYGVRSLVARTQSLKSSFSRFICLKLMGVSQHHFKSMFFNIFYPFVWEKSTLWSFIFFYVFRVCLKIMKIGVRYLDALPPSTGICFNTGDCKLQFRNVDIPFSRHVHIKCICTRCNRYNQKSIPQYMYFSGKNIFRRCNPPDFISTCSYKGMVIISELGGLGEFLATPHFNVGPSHLVTHFCRDPPVLLKIKFMTLPPIRQIQNSKL